MTFVIFTTVLLGLLAKIFIPIWRNYVAARETGLPIVTSLIDPTSALWALTKRIFLPYLSLLPGDVGRNSKLNVFGWQFRAKNTVHQRLGNVFVQVTPSHNIVNIADPDLIQQVFQRIDDFPKPRQIYRRLEVFGPNLDSLNGDDWKRHRKLTAPAFNERVSSLVWEEGSTQARLLLEVIYATSTRTTQNITETCQAIAHHVLAYAGFGVRSQHGIDVTDLPPGHQLAYNDALCTVLANMVLAIVMPARVLTSSLAPKRWQKVGLAFREFSKYMQEILEQERTTTENGIAVGGSPRRSESLTSALIKASEEEKNTAGKDSAKGLSDEEVYGNMFIFNFAGQDTTANTMAYAIALMAIHPEIQEWVREEVVAVFSQHNPQEYDQVFPLLKRVRALMYETLRLYPPIVYLPKLTSSTPTVLSATDGDSQRRDIVIPPNSYVVVNFMHLHCSHELWGKNALKFRPSRWIASPDSHETSSGSGYSKDEKLERPPPGAFIPWAMGPRNCPGMKFAQVEFVSVIASLLVDSRVEAALPPALQDQAELKGLHGMEITDLARERLSSVVEDSDVRVTTTMLRPDEVWLRWRRIT
ncbi:hypothetical protein KVR01_006032 [Diaporthe batatas]|uniref:uncharacterized protein n=1 Tax=Diaporthe batatas TaxID=748121 RepID=UPI001D04E36B|nr:uncharacterized protein KVR01_006032 [Diaporthe batatas]KAG8164114.1 hypothetical protein KVR01_006032 [Diaporthe batatas]